MYEKIELDEILLEIISRCNLNCKHCFNRPGDNAVDMSLDDINRIINKCLKHGLKKVALSGGEPLVHPQIKEIIQNCKNYPDITFTITTNGLLLNKEFIDLMRPIPNIELQISIDGTTKEIYEATRGENTFSQFYKGFLLMAKSKIKTLISRTCITKLNYKNVSEIYKMSLDNKMTPSFIFITPQGNAVENMEDFSLTLAQKIHAIDTINRLNEQYNISIPPPSAANRCDFAEDLQRKALLIKSDGNVAPCQFYYDGIIGNILESDVEQILTLDNEILKELYVKGKKRKEKLCKTKKCKECKLKPVCLMGCMGLALELGNEMGLDGECNFKICLESCYANKIIKTERQV